MRNEYEVYTEAVSRLLGELISQKPQDLDAMEVRINYSPGDRKPTIEVPVYGGIEKLADKLHRPVRIENSVGNFYTKEVQHGNVVFSFTGVGKA